jgi:hypothetical protein
MPEVFRIAPRGNRLESEQRLRAVSAGARKRVLWLDASFTQDGRSIEEGKIASGCRKERGIWRNEGDEVNAIPAEVRSAGRRSEPILSLELLGPLV